MLSWKCLQLVQTSHYALLAGLKACSITRNLTRGKKLHAEAVECGHANICVWNALINMYAKCGSMVDARHVFDSIKHPSVVSWNVLIMGYAENGQGTTALNFFTKMKTATPNSVTFVASLKACTFFACGGFSKCRDFGRALHNLAIEKGCYSEIHVQCTLIDMYAKCGCMLDAHRVFDSMADPNVVSWTALILGYAENGKGIPALDLFTRMKDEGLVPDSLTLVAALKACISLAAEGIFFLAECREQGKILHNLAMEDDCNSIYVQGALIDLYAKCSSMVDAHQVFDMMTHPNVVCWTALILGYANNGQGLTALDLFTRMRNTGPAPNSVTFVSALKACIALSAQDGLSEWTAVCRLKGKEIHDLAMQNECNSNSYVQSTLIEMYSKCGSIVEARQVFDSLKHPAVVSWNTMILGYAANGQGLSALDLFTRMNSGGPALDSVTLLAALKACICFEAEECKNRGKKIHNLAIENGIISDVNVQNTLIDMYTKCRSIVHARQVFDMMEHRNVVSWNVLILGYVENEQGLTALDLFMRMKSEGPSVDCITFLAVLKACALVGWLEFGRVVHLEMGSHLDVILVNCLVDFYAKCGSMVEAKRVFAMHDKTRNLVTWTALLAGFSNTGDHESVFGILAAMQDAGCQPEPVTFVSILACCSHSGLVEKGKECFDAMSTKYGIFPTIEHYTCMVDIFGRSNKLDDAMALFKSMPWSPDDVIWTTILGACRKWKNVGIGRLAFLSLIQINKSDASAYVQMGQIYGSRGMFHEQEVVMEMSTKNITFHSHETETGIRFPTVP